MLTFFWAVQKNLYLKALPADLIRNLSTNIAPWAWFWQTKATFLTSQAFWLVSLSQHSLRISKNQVRNKPFFNCCFSEPRVFAIYSSRICHIFKRQIQWKQILLNINLGQEGQKFLNLCLMNHFYQYLYLQLLSIFCLKVSTVKP